MTANEFIARFDGLSRDQHTHAINHFVGAISYIATDYPDNMFCKKAICEALERSIESAKKIFPEGKIA